MTIEDHLNKARQLCTVNPLGAMSELALAITLAAKGGPSVTNARQVLIDAFKEDPEWRQTYVDNIACVIMDFDKGLSHPPTERTPLSHSDRQALAERIFNHLFS